MRTVKYKIELPLAQQKVCNEVELQYTNASHTIPAKTVSYSGFVARAIESS